MNHTYFRKGFLGSFFFLFAPVYFGLKNKPNQGKIDELERLDKDMKHITDFKDKKVLVLGLAKSGESAARLLDKLGAIVTVNDGKPFDENPTAQSLLEDGIRVICGSHPLELLDEDFALLVKNPGIRYDNPMVERALQKGMPVWTDRGSQCRWSICKTLWEHRISSFQCGSRSYQGRYFGDGIILLPAYGCPRF